MSFKEKVKSAIKGKLEKSSVSSIFILGRPSPEEEGVEIAKSILEGKCPRDGADIREKEFCPGCGGKVELMLAAVKGFKK